MSAQIRIADLAQLADGTVHGDGDTTVSSISLDSSKVAEGGMFAALPGTRVHGAQYAASAVGAAAVLTDAAGLENLRAAGVELPVVEVADIRAVLGAISAEIYGHPSDNLTIIGITGTSGKTTTSYLVEAGLLEAGHSVGLIGTTGTRINRTPVPTSLTTPEAPRLQELFADMLAQGVTHVVMEVSSHALELGRVQGTRFAVGGFTNLSQDHLDFHPTMEDYFNAKAILFDGAHAQAAVVCVDDMWGTRMADIAAGKGLPVTRVSTAAGSDNCLGAHTVEVEPTGAQTVEFKLADAAPIRFRLPLPGPFNVANAALAAGLGQAAGADMEAFIRGMSKVAVPGRMERIDRGQEFIAVVDYAHKPAAVSAVLDSLREQLGQTGRIGIVVGAGGDRDAAKRPIMGRNAADRAEFVIVTDDNPRTEDPATIRAAVMAGALESPRCETGETQVVEVASRAEAIDQLVAWATPGDAIIVVGKGHEVGQIVGTEVHHFDDREEMARALEETLGAAVSADGHVDGVSAGKEEK